MATRTCLARHMVRQDLRLPTPVVPMRHTSSNRNSSSSNSSSCRNSNNIRCHRHLPSALRAVTPLFTRDPSRLTPPRHLHPLKASTSTGILIHTIALLRQTAHTPLNITVNRHSPRRPLALLCPPDNDNLLLLRATHTLRALTNNECRLLRRISVNLTPPLLLHHRPPYLALPVHILPTTPASTTPTEDPSPTANARGVLASVRKPACRAFRAVLAALRPHPHRQLPTLKCAPSNLRWPV